MNLLALAFLFHAPEPWYDNRDPNHRIRQAVEIAHESLVIQRAVQPGDPAAPFVFEDALSTDGLNFLATEVALWGVTRCDSVEAGFSETFRLFPRIRKLTQTLEKLTRDADPSPRELRKIAAVVDELAVLRKRVFEAYPPAWNEPTDELRYQWDFDPIELLGLPKGTSLRDLEFVPSAVITPAGRDPGGFHISLHWAFMSFSWTPYSISARRPISPSDACLGDLRAEVRGILRGEYLESDGSSVKAERELILYGDNRHGRVER